MASSGDCVGRAGTESGRSDLLHWLSALAISSCSPQPDTPSLKSPKASSPAGMLFAESPAPGSTVLFRSACSQCLEGMEHEDQVPFCWGKAAGPSAAMLAVSLSRRADQRGRRQTGLGTPFFPAQPGWRRGPNTWPPTGVGVCTVGHWRGSMAEGAWQGHRVCFQVSAQSLGPPWSLSHRGGGVNGWKQAFLPACGPQGAAELLSLGKEPPEALSRLWPLPHPQALASQEAFPEGRCISMVTVLGVPPPGSPSSAPSRRARWKTTLRGSQSRCDLSLPARK